MEGDNTPGSPLVGEHVSFFAADRLREVGKTSVVGSEGQWRLTVTSNPVRGGLYLTDTPVATVAIVIKSRNPKSEAEEYDEVICEISKRVMRMDDPMFSEWIHHSVVYPTLRTMKMDESVRLELPAGTHPDFKDDLDLCVDLTLFDFFNETSVWPMEMEFKGSPVMMYISQRHQSTSWKPANMDLVRVHYRLETADDHELIYDTREDDKPHSFTVGCGDVIPGLDLGIMKLGIRQFANIEMDATAGFGPYDTSSELRDLFVAQARGGDYLYDRLEEVFDDPSVFTGSEGRSAICVDKREMCLPTDLNPNHGVLKSSIDMRSYQEKYRGRRLVAKDVRIIDLYALGGATVFRSNQRMAYVRRVLEIAKRYFQVEDMIRAERLYSEAAYAMSESSATEFGTADRRAEESRIRCNRALVYLKLGHLEQAEIMLNEVLKNNADHAKASFLMGRLCERREDDALAEMWYRRCLISDKQNAEAREALKQVLLRQKSTSPSEKEKALKMIDAAEFAEDRPRTEYVKIHDDLELPVDASLNMRLLDQFGLSLRRKEAEVSSGENQAPHESERATEIVTEAESPDSSE